MKVLEGAMSASLQEGSDGRVELALKLSPTYGIHGALEDFIVSSARQVLSQFKVGSTFSTGVDGQKVELEFEQEDINLIRRNLNLND